jgi:hypothetical protein
MEPFVRFRQMLLKDFPEPRTCRFFIYEAAIRQVAA